MKRTLSAGILLLALAAPAQAQEAQPPSALEDGFAGALRGCEAWILTPELWVDGFGPFIEAVGLGDIMGEVTDAPLPALPPEEYRLANHYWRINSTTQAGYFLVVSDQLPMCHITGGGGTDFQPVVEAVLVSDEFLAHWQVVGDNSDEDMASTLYSNIEEPALTLLVSRSTTAGQRQDRAQIVATAQIDFGD